MDYLAGNVQLVIAIFGKNFFKKIFLFMVFFIQNLLKHPIITKNPHLKDEDFLTLQKKVVHYWNT